MKSFKLKSLKAFNLVKRQERGFLSKIKGQLDKAFEAHPYEKNPAILDSNLAMYTEMRQFQAYVTKNAYDMSVFNEYDTWPHVNYGTIDNPLLIFGAGTTWRMVVCSGPGSEEESSSHEKMYFIVREGPIHRCIMCGQCFKLVKLRDEVASAENMYYSSVFTQIADRVVGELEDFSIFTHNFTMSDPRDYRSNIIPKDRAYAFVNADEADHIMVDPAYRMEFYKNLETDYYKRRRVSGEIARQAELAGIDFQKKTKMDKDVYETWIKIEKEILKFDRVYNRYEKFMGRALFDPKNHERRERRMLQRKAEREEENYTYYQGGLTESEQMYRDYYESDIEEFQDNEYYNERLDSALLASTGQFDLNKYDLAEENTLRLNRAPADSIIDSLIFRHKYRDVADKEFARRSARVSERAHQRALNRDSKVVKDLGDVVEEIYARKSNFISADEVEKELLPFASYVAEEGLQQFKDYYESDIEAGEINGDLLNDLSERDRIRFSECYLNELNKSLITDKEYVMIPKRPFDNSLSVVGNFFFDLVDFNFRVRPIARNLAFRDVSARFQPLPVNSEEREITEDDNKRYRPILEFKKSSNTVNNDNLLTGNRH